MPVVKFSDARKSLKRVQDETIADQNYTIITQADAPDAVLMSIGTFNSLMETVHLMKTSANAAHIAGSIDQYIKGKTVAHNLEKSW